MPSPFIGILICVTIYAIGSGLIEVLVSPIIEACPFDNKDVMMSLLHSFYCWGTVGVILISTIFFKFFGIGNWKLLAILWAIVPFYNIFNFATCPIEKLVDDGQSMTIGELLRSKTFWLFILLMVCAGSSEIAMSQWASAFVESALHMSKAVGDLAGPCGFAVLMGISRTLYGKFGEKIDLTGFMIASGILCLICYLLAALSSACNGTLLAALYADFQLVSCGPDPLAYLLKLSQGEVQRCLHFLLLQEIWAVLPDLRS